MLNLTKPQTGDTNWGNTLNDNFTAIETAVNNKAENSTVATHLTAVNAHSADKISSSVAGQANVETALSWLNLNKAASNHTHSDINISSSAISGQSNVNSAIMHLNSVKASQTALTTLDSRVTAHIGSGEAHNADNILSQVIEGQSNVDKALQYLNDNKANASELLAIRNLLTYIDADLTGVTVSVNVQSLTNGLACHISTNPPVYLRQYNIEVKKVIGTNEVTLYNGGGGSAYQQFTSNDPTIFTGGSVFKIKASVVSGISGWKDSLPVTFLWHNPNPNVVVNYDIIADTDTYTISEDKIKDLIGWSGLEESINDGIVLMVVDKKSNPHTVINTFSVKHQTHNSVDHLENISITNLVKDNPYKITMYISKINAK